MENLPHCVRLRTLSLTSVTRFSRIPHCIILNRVSVCLGIPSTTARLPCVLDLVYSTFFRYLTPFSYWNIGRPHSIDWAPPVRGWTTRSIKGATHYWRRTPILLARRSSSSTQNAIT